jgi:ribonucleoside-diphosphate reductase alpha chain
VARVDDTEKTLAAKVEIAAVLGTIQSTYTNFPYLRKIWQRNTEEERLLGVSITGIMDSKLLSGLRDNEKSANLLSHLKSIGVKTNKKLADKLGIEQSTAITCVKPSGTVSQLVDSASGIHARHSEYYVRTVRGDNKDPLTQFMIAKGIPNEPDVTKPDTTTVFSFPVQAPKGCITRNDMTAIEQLDMWLLFQRHWCEHKPSVTITVREHEWIAVGAWVYANFDEVSGVSFLPHSDHSYRQAPYQEIDRAAFLNKTVEMPKAVQWSDLTEFELEDTTVASQTLACTGGSCEL